VAVERKGERSANSFAAGSLLRFGVVAYCFWGLFLYRSRFIVIGVSLLFCDAVLSTLFYFNLIFYC